MSDMTTAQQAAATLEADRRERAQRASDEIAAILKREECDLVAVPQLTPDGRVVAVVQLIAR